MFRINKVIAYIHLTILMIALLYYNFFSFGLSSTLILTIVSTVFISTLLFFSRYENINELRRNFLKHSNFFIIGFLIVSFQSHIDYYLGNIEKVELTLATSDIAVAKSMVISLIGLLCFFIGYAITKKPDIYREKSKESHLISTKLISFLIFIFLLLYLINIDPRYLYGGYGTYGMGLNALYFSLLFKCSYIALITQKIINSNAMNKNINSVFSYVKYIGYTNLLFLFIYLLPVLISGDRGDIIVFALLLAVGYVIICDKKINYFKGVIIIISASFFITILGVARSFNSTYDSGFINNINKALSKDSKEINSILPATSELAISSKALHYSVEYVPEYYGYLYVDFHIKSLLSIIPLSANIYPYLFNDISNKYNSSDAYVTWLIERVESPSSGHGTSILADFYLSYGLIGVSFGMLLFGSLLRYCEQQIVVKNNTHLFLLVTSIVIFCYCVYLSRSSVVQLFRQIVWTWVIVKLNQSMLKRVGR